MYVFVGCSVRRYKTIHGVAVDPKAKSDSEAVADALLWGADIEDIDRVEIWDNMSNQLVCALDLA